MTHLEFLALSEPERHAHLQGLSVTARLELALALAQHIHRQWDQVGEALFEGLERKLTPTDPSHLLMHELLDRARRAAPG